MAQHPASLVLSDLHMPVLDGMELLHELRRQYPDAAVMMITAVADVSTAVSCLSKGAMDYLVKPFHLEEVRARVRQALDRRRLVIENRDYQERLEGKVMVQRAARRALPREHPVAGGCARSQGSLHAGPLPARLAALGRHCPHVEAGA